MTIEDAKKLKAAWGDKPCNHPAIEKEREAFGAHTGDYRCNQCGKLFLSYEEWERSRPKPPAGK